MKFFKNMMMFRFSSPFTLSPEQVEKKLRPFVPCGELEKGSWGFVPPMGDLSDRLVHVTDGRLLVCLQTEVRLLPGDVVKRELNERVAYIERTQGRTVGRKERSTLKEYVIEELIPRSFTRLHTTQAYLDPKAGWLVVDTASEKKSEELTIALRGCLGSLPVVPLLPRQNPIQSMTAWIKNKDMPDGFSADSGCCDLEDYMETGGKARLSHHDLNADEVQAHLQAGKQVVKLALVYAERLSLVLDHGLVVRRLRLLDVQQEPPAETEDPLALADAEFLIMASEIDNLLSGLVTAFGGLADGQKKEAA